jgi:predicted homoserine dehydrogenase-like protein
VQMNLYRFVKSIGLTPIGLRQHQRVCKIDIVIPTTQESFAKTWGQTPSMVTSFADGTKISFEQAIVANATGMKVAQRGMLGYEYPKGTIDDMIDRYDIDQLRELGEALSTMLSRQSQALECLCLPPTKMTPSRPII